ncbi:MAG TPA: protein kinase [Planctomycetota bacterium]|nr:protein kinase [Planctomycetota bacterium]
MAADVGALASGSVLGEWTIARKLGEGSMGLVFMARNRAGTQAAVKVVRPEIIATPDAAARFKREGKLLQRIEHKNVVRLLDVGEADGLSFLALEFVPGDSLAARLEKGTLDAADGIKLAADMLRGLAAVHDAGIFHRDMKPGNVLLSPTGDWKITDFGLARRAGAESIAVTRPGAILGTPYYMAPEQCKGEPADARSDLYAAGATIYHALAGEPPYTGKLVMDVIRGHLESPVPDVSVKAPRIPPKLVQLVTRLLGKTREERFPDARSALAFLGVEDAPSFSTGGETFVPPAKPRPTTPLAQPRPQTPLAQPRPQTPPAQPRPQTPLAQPRPQTPLAAPRPETPATPPPAMPRPQTPLPAPRPAVPAPAATPPAPPAVPASPAEVRSTKKWSIGTSVAPPAPTRSATPAQSQPRSNVLTESGRVPGIIKPETVRRGNRIPWERATLPMAPAVLGLFLYFLSRIMSREQLYDDYVGTSWIRLAALIGAGAGLWRVFTGFYEVNAPPLAKRKWFYLRVIWRIRVWLLKGGSPKKAAQALRDLGDFLAAGELLYKAGFLREAGAEFLRANETVRAAKIFERVQDTDAANRAKAAGGDDTRAAAYVALRAGKFEEAAKLFARLSDFTGSADAWQRAGKPLEAANAFESCGRLEDAGNEIARALENTQGAFSKLRFEERHAYAVKAANLFSRAGAALGAAGRFERMGEIELAEQLYEEGGDLAAAARIASRLGQHARAADLYTRAGRVHEAAKEQGEALLEAGKAAGTTSSLARAADTESLKKAAKAFEDAGELRRAADLYARSTDLASAARLYEKLGDWREASLCYRELGDPVAAARVLEQADPIAAAERWAAEGKAEEALRVLEGVGSSSPRRGRAVALKGDLHLKAGHESEAIAAFADAIEGANAADSDQVANVGHAAEALAKLGRLDQAIEQLARLRQRIGGDAPELDRIAGDLNVRRRTGVGGPELVGCIVDRYKVISLLGEGGTAWVYDAEHAFLGRRVALKVLKPHPMGGDDLATRFYSEAQVTASLRHQNVIHIFDVGETPGGLLYMALEIIRGPGLRKLLETEKKLPVERAAKIMIGVLSGLAAAHAKGMVHRDLKPENILLAKGELPKVVDFGLAKLAGKKMVTMTGAYLGTPKYASPEQAQGVEATVASDIYACGLILYEMLAGRVPFTSESPLGFLTLHAGATAAPHVASFVSDIPAQLATTCMRAIEKDPTKRFPDAESFRQALLPFTGVSGELRRA